MIIKTTLFAVTILLVSCNSNTNNNEADLKSLNEKSLKCVAIMNKAEALQSEAITNGNKAEITMYQKTIDSAALENAKIGQQMMQMESK